MNWSLLKNVPQCAIEEDLVNLWNWELNPLEMKSQKGVRNKHFLLISK